MKQHLAFLLLSLLAVQTALGSAGLHALAMGNLTFKCSNDNSGHASCCSFVSFAPPLCETANQCPLKGVAAQHKCLICHYFSLDMAKTCWGAKWCFVRRVPLDNETAVNVGSFEIERRILPRGPPKRDASTVPIT